MSIFTEFIISTRPTVTADPNTLQREVLTTIMNNSTTFTNSIKSRIIGLRANFVQNKVVTASDLNGIIQIWNEFNNHTHNLQDVYGTKSYGNINPPSYPVFPGRAEMTNSVFSSLIGTTIGTVGSSDKVSSQKHNEIRFKLSSGMNHSHLWQDRIA
jgi:hypothetical protein